MGCSSLSRPVEPKSVQQIITETGGDDIATEENCQDGSDKATNPTPPTASVNSSPLHKGKVAPIPIEKDDHVESGTNHEVPATSKVVQPRSVHGRKHSLGTWSMPKPKISPRLDIRNSIILVGEDQTLGDMPISPRSARRKNKGTPIEVTSKVTSAKFERRISTMTQGHIRRESKSVQMATALMHPARQQTESSVDIAHSINNITEFQVDDLIKRSESISEVKARMSLRNVHAAIYSENRPESVEKPAIDEVEEEDDEGEGEEPLELCGNCATETSTIICLECTKCYCVGCDARYHRPKRFTGHQRFFVNSGAPLTEGAGFSLAEGGSSSESKCDNCEMVNYVTMTCQECSMELCPTCDTRIHKIKTKLGHLRTLGYNSKSGKGHQVSLKLACKSLPRMDFMSESDPYVIVEIGREGFEEFTEVGRTETHQDQPNPVFETDIELGLLERDVGLLHMMRFHIYDHDDFLRDDLIGDVEFLLADLLGSAEACLTRPLIRKGKAAGMASLRVRADVRVIKETALSSDQKVKGSKGGSKISRRNKREFQEHTGGDVIKINLEAMGDSKVIAFPIGERQIWQVSTGHDFIAMLSVGGLLFVAGENHSGQLGTGDTESRLAPTAIHVPSAVYVSCGYEHCLAVSSSGDCYSWGSGKLGKLGNGSDQDVYEPSLIKMEALEKQRCVSCSCSHYNSGVITDIQQVFMFGAGDAGVIGNGKREPAFTPTLVQKLENVIALSFGERHAGAVTTNDVFTWGDSDFGRLGYEVTEEGEGVEDELQLVPRSIDFNKPCVDIRCGTMHTTILTESGRVFSFGSGETHQIGVMDNVDQIAPIEAEAITERRIVSIGVGETLSGAVSSSGDVFMWGFAAETPIPKKFPELCGMSVSSLSLGGPTSLLAHTQPPHEIFQIKASKKKPSAIARHDLQGPILLQIASGHENWISVSHHHDIFVWGDHNEHGVLGIGSGDESIAIPIPRKLQFPKNVDTVCCGLKHCMALNRAGRVYTWGCGISGVLGHDSENDVYAPTLVKALVDQVIISIAAGSSNSAAISLDEVFVWGAGESGQIGDGEQSPRLVPTRVEPLEGKEVCHIAVGNKHALALSKSSAVWVWGSNEFSQLGMELDDDKELSLTPIENPTLTALKCAAVYCSDQTSFVRTLDGGIYIFGSSDSNQAGQQVDKEMNISTPLKIPILDSNKQPVEVSQLSVSRTLCAAVSKEYGRAFVWGWQVSKTPLHIAKSYMGHKQCQHVCCGKGTILVYCDL